MQRTVIAFVSQVCVGGSLSRSQSQCVADRGEEGRKICNNTCCTAHQVSVFLTHEREREITRMR